MKPVDAERNDNTEKLPVVNSFNEWDPLEEVIVGVVDGATVPEWHVSLEATMPENQWEFYKKNGGKPFPQDQIDAANKDLDAFVHIMESEGIIVRRPDVMAHHKPFKTQEFESPGGLYAAMPRDTILVIGDDIIEVPMAWRSRYYEHNAYRRLIKEYFHKGARWTMAPKPELPDDFYDNNYTEPKEGEPMKYVINEYEPTFDAADFIKCGRDIFCQKSHVTNSFGIEWLRRHLGDDYRIHEIEVNDTHPMHIDASFMPLAPGKLVVNKERVAKIPEMFKSWDVMYAPEPNMSTSHTLYMTSRWINMNVFMLDHERVVVEQGEESIIKAFKDFGLKPIPCSFTNFNTFGGSFHCATLDIRRKGVLESYF